MSVKLPKNITEAQATLPDPPQVTFSGHIAAGFRLVRHRYFRRIHQFEGGAERICEHILARLWKRKFYMTGLGHFTYLWIRDFGSVAESLVALGHTDRVQKTLHWSLHQYRRGGKVTLCIDRLGQIFNAPEQSIDALPWLLHAIVVSRYKLDDHERIFLEQQLIEYRETFLDSRGMLQHGHYAELRDGVLYDQSAYALTMVARLAVCVESLHLAGFHFSPGVYQKRLLGKYWNGDYFNADIETKAFSAEGALMPFVLNIVDDADMANKTFAYIEKHGLNRPYPLRYTNKPSAFRYRLWAWTIMRNYAGTTIWTWHGAFYLQLLKRYKHPDYAAQLASFEYMISHYGTFPELLNPDGSWYKTPFYKGDQAMIWCAVYLALK